MIPDQNEHRRAGRIRSLRGGRPQLLLQAVTWFQFKYSIEFRQREEGPPRMPRLRIAGPFFGVTGASYERTTTVSDFPGRTAKRSEIGVGAFHCPPDISYSNGEHLFLENADRPSPIRRREANLVC